VCGYAIPDSVEFDTCVTLASRQIIDSKSVAVETDVALLSSRTANFD